MTAPLELGVARRRLVVDSLGIWASIIVVGTIFGFTARQANLSLLETSALSAILFAGASQFAVVGLLASGVAWPSIALLVWLLNARHLLYSASIAPHTARLTRRLRAVIALLLTDEAFALTSAHLERLGNCPGFSDSWVGLNRVQPFLNRNDACQQNSPVRQCVNGLIGDHADAIAHGNH